MRILRAAERIAMPWKNGGGVTREVAAWPPCAGISGFDWRVSMADVAVDAPFSAFPDVDRVLTVIEGDGLVLEIEGEALRLEAGAPFAFPGEAAVTARLTAGPIRDLNVMVRHGAWAAKVEPWRGGPIEAGQGPTLVVPLDAAQDLAALDVLFFDAGETASLGFTLRTRALTIALQPIAPTTGQPRSVKLQA